MVRARNEIAKNPCTTYELAKRMGIKANNLLWVIDFLTFWTRLAEDDDGTLFYPTREDATFRVHPFACNDIESLILKDMEVKEWDEQNIS